MCLSLIWGETTLEYAEQFAQMCKLKLEDLQTLSDEFRPIAKSCLDGIDLRHHLAEHGFGIKNREHDAIVVRLRGKEAARLRRQWAE